MLPESNTELFTITLNNFDKHQVRKDVQSMHWIKLSTSMISDEKVMMLNTSTKWLMISLMCSSGRVGTEKRQTSVRVEAEKTQIRTDHCRAGLLKLESLQILSISRRHANVPRKKERKKERVHCDFDLSLIYDAYPRKEKRHPGMMKLEKIVNDEATFKKILEASHAFKNHHELKGTEKKYIPTFSTWVNQERYNDQLTNEEIEPQDEYLF